MGISLDVGALVGLQVVELHLSDDFRGLGKPDGDVLSGDLPNVQSNELGLKFLNSRQRRTIELDEERIQDVASVFLRINKGGVIVQGSLQGQSA